MSDLQKRLQMSRLPPKPAVPTGVPPSGTSRPAAKGRPRRDYTPTTWDAYFSSKRDVKIENNTFRLYESGTAGPVCMLLHGGGFSALSWAVFSKILVHLVDCRMLAVDLRGHGDTYTTDDEDMSAKTLAADVGHIVSEVYGSEAQQIFLMGHSMGGAVAVHAAVGACVPSLIGLAVIDVVEVLIGQATIDGVKGTALDALSAMQGLIRSRPNSFKSLAEAIEWSIRSGHIRNLESAKVSMVGQLKKRSTDEPATAVIEPHAYTAGQVLPQGVTSGTTPTIAEEEEEPTAAQTTQTASNTTFTVPPSVQMPNDDYTWRIDLTKTEPYWRGWFEGLSQLFLSCHVPKLLLLAGVDRLDKDLTIGQMQGKFQMQVLPQCGHAVHEDSPDKVADVIANFLVRHKMAQATSNFTRTFPAC